MKYLLNECNYFFLNDVISLLLTYKTGYNILLNFKWLKEYVVLESFVHFIISSWIIE